MAVKLFEVFIKEPVLITNVIAAVVAILVVVGISVPVGLEAAIAGFILAVGSLIARAFVTPV